MTQFASVLPNPATPPTATQERMQAERERLGQRGPLRGLPFGGLIQFASDNIESEWATSWLFRKLGRAGYEIDPDFQLSDELLDKLGENLPTEYRREFASAVSLSHAKRIRQQLVEVNEARERLNRQGWIGVAGRMAASVLDPAFIASNAVTGGLLGSVVKAETMIGKMARGGLIAAASDVPVQAFISNEDPDQGAAEVLYTLAGAAVLGGAGDAFRHYRIMQRIQKAAELDTLDRGIVAMGAASPGSIHGGYLTGAAELRAAVTSDKGRAYFRELLSPEARAAYKDNMIRLAGLDDANPGHAELIDEIRKAPIDQFIDRAQVMLDEADLTPVKPPTGHIDDGGKAEKPPTAPPRELTADDLDQSWIGEANVPSYRFWRLNWFNRLRKTDALSLRMLGAGSLEDALLKKNKAGKYVRAGRSGEEFAHARTNQIITTYHQKVDEPLAKIMRHLDLHGEQGRAEVMDMLGRLQDTGQLPKALRAVESDARKILSAFDEAVGSAGRTAKRMRTAGFDKFEITPGYIPRLWSRGRIVAATAQHGEETVIQAIANGLLARSEGLSQESAEKIAKAFKRAILRDEYNDIDAARFLEQDRADLLEEMLRDELIESGMPTARVDETIKNILYNVQPQGDKGKGLVGFARKRLDMDTTATDDTGRLLLADLLETNLDYHAHTYARQVLGEAAMQETLRHISFMHGRVDEAGEPTIRRVAQLKPIIHKEMRALGQTETQIKHALALVDEVDRHVRGFPVHGEKPWHKFARAARAFNYIRAGASFMAAQLPELANVTSQIGLRATIAQIPHMGTIIKLARRGELSDEFAREIEQVFTSGVDPLLHRHSTRFDPETGLIEAGEAGLTDRVLKRGQRLTSAMSGLDGVNRVIQTVAARGAIHNLLRRARRGTKLAEREMLALGFDEARWQRVIDAARKHKGEPLRLDKWTDQQAAADFRYAIDRWSRNMAQRSGIGARPLFMTKELGKVLMQFRTFGVEAWEKQFLHRIQQRSLPMVMSAVWTTIAGGLVYIARTHLALAGRDDRKEELQRRLTPERIAAAAISNGSWASLIPAAADQFIQPITGEPFFGHSRTSGQAATGFLQNPTMELGDSLLAAFGSTVGAAIRDDEDFTRADARRAQRLLPWQNHFIVAPIINQLINTRPESEPR